LDLFHQDNNLPDLWWGGDANEKALSLFDLEGAKGRKAVFGLVLNPFFIIDIDAGED
jgi:hypothetical protein